MRGVSSLAVASIAANSILSTADRTLRLVL